MIKINRKNQVKLCGRPGRLLNVLCTFNLRPVSRGELLLRFSIETTSKKMLRNFLTEHHVDAILTFRALTNRLESAIKNKSNPNKSV